MPRYLSICRIKSIAPEYNIYKMELGGDTVLFLGEIPNMPGHCAIATHSGKIDFGFHTNSFEEIPQEEV